MPKSVEGKLSSGGLKIAVIAARFNGFIVDQLVAGAVDAVVRTGGREQDVTVFRAPGAFEVPQVLRRVLARGGFDAVVCLGAVIRGATPHFEHVAGAVSTGVARLAAEADVPVAFGVLTTDTIEQAIERAGTKAGNKGFEAAMAAIEMANLYRAIEG
jgi:6,7-dimethyl-8-ribityllumazine synthase